MKVTVLCTDPAHPVMPWLERWQRETTAKGHSVELCADKAAARGGDLLFLVSCSQIVGDGERGRYRAVLVLHASDLPKGRGWSPHIWSILNGADRITVTLLEARDPADTGDIWVQDAFTLEGHELLPEIHEKLFRCELDLMTRAVEGWERIRPVPQAGDPGPYMRKRTPEHSRLDPHKTLAEQFDLLRVVDNRRYPAFMDHRGKRYVITIDKAGHEQ